MSFRTEVPSRMPARQGIGSCGQRGICLRNLGTGIGEWGSKVRLGRGEGCKTGGCRVGEYSGGGGG